MDYNKIYSIKRILPRVNAVNYFTLTDVSSWGPRELPDFELILIREGAFLYERLDQTALHESENDSTEIYLGPGDILIIPPGENHLFSAVHKKGAISCIHCLPSEDAPWNTGLVSLFPQPRYKTSLREKQAELDALFRKCNFLFSGYDNYRDELLTTACREIWLHCASKWESSDLLLSPRMEAMIAYIQNNCTGTLTRQDLSARFSLSPEYINALFKKELGLTPTACINRERILLAYKYLQRDGLSVSETAFRCGFNDPFYFSRVFKKELGIPPGTLKNRKYFI